MSKAGTTSAAKSARKPTKAKSKAAVPAASPAKTPVRSKAPSKKAAPAALSADLKPLERLLGYTFTQPALLELAVTHRSHTYEARHGVPAVILPAHPEQRDQRNTPGTDNEQMEFLGDAVLGLVVTEALFREFPQCSEGDLTRLRANLVSRKRMAEVGQALGLNVALRLGKSAEQNGGRQKSALLANAAEAVLAAVYLDARAATGEGMTAVRALAEKYLIQLELAALRAAVSSDVGRALRDHKTLLQERVQATGAGRLRYIDISESGPPHMKHFVVEAQLEREGTLHPLAQGEGGSKKEAQQAAAALALADWTDPKPENTASAEGAP
jgi:ribonuclease-3